MHRVGYLLHPGFQFMTLGTQSVFEFANYEVRERFYDLALYSPGGGQLRSSSGVDVVTRPLASSTQADSWLVSHSVTPLQTSPDPAALALLRRAERHARRIVGLCTGSFVLAEAGLLKGRRATTHWAHAASLRERYPDTLVEEDRIFIVDGPVWTSAGMSAAFDLCLAMVEKDLGDDVARSVAHSLVMQHRRAGGQTQHSQLLQIAPKSDRVQAALDYARANLKNELNVEELAAVATLSPRQFSRVFTQETGVSPARAVEGLRVEAARLMIERSRHPLEVVARETGFRDRRHLREVFVRRLGVPPQSARRAARGVAG
ncbi:GlxA family transcriptional regulator [Piscinibacter sakaiensis]|uniref:Transcriptional regulator with amidase-and AraC-type DNA-binding HTH-domains n=1 Tax=Piscinibacter sakaiensis TaxID=1547922 RepID=A0A0K8P147_PISS1|nr:GlxA family transcriptional regulator [Piscinibacter sakaiensis]GAP35895.1 transcriptional regulator with amidase- and AraC-type DNA-binding HTH-domains [Piscinibacter sakaiensis]